MSTFLKTDLAGKINNLPHFKNEALLPVFEAVANAIQAIEERGNLISGEITVYIRRAAQRTLDDTSGDNESNIVGFDVIDNGIGFDDINLESFKTAETTHKLEKGCKGVGRFFWLKAFSGVEIESVYAHGEQKKVRKIKFSVNDGIEEVENEPTDGEHKTTVRLLGFRREYRDQPSAYKTTQKIAQRIMEHCLSYFISGLAPNVVVKDSEESFCLNLMFSEIEKNITTEPLNIADQQFNISHIRLYSTHSKMHNLVFCANRRDVQSVKISSLLGTSSEFDESDKKFTYTAYVTSPYLDRHVHASRIAFDIPEERSELIDNDVAISINEMKAAVVERSREFLSEYLDIVRVRKQEIVMDHVANKNPTLRAVAHYCPEVFDEIEPNTPEEKIEEILYKHKGRAEFQIRKRGQKLLKTQAASFDEIKEEYASITDEAGDFQKDQLAAYVIFRKMILDLLEKKLSLNSQGAYSNEDIIHDIIFPRKTTTDQLDVHEHNLWLLDERLNFHAFAASDKPLSSISTSDSDERPDILTFAEIDDDRVARSVSIIELKKPQRTHLDENPTTQLYRYVRNIRDGRVKLPTGRDLVVNDSTRFYCYAVCDINAQVREFAENNNYALLKGELGYYQYNRALNAHSEIIAFDKIVADATRRNKIFFEKLGI